METIIGMIGLSVFFLLCAGAAKLIQGSNFGRALHKEMDRKRR